MKRILYLILSIILVFVPLSGNAENYKSAKSGKTSLDYATTPMKNLVDSKIKSGLVASINYTKAINNLPQNMKISVNLSQKVECALKANEELPLSIYNQFASFDLLGSIGGILNDQVNAKCGLGQGYPTLRVFEKSASPVQAFGGFLKDEPNLFKAISLNNRVGITLRKDDKNILIAFYFPKHP